MKMKHARRGSFDLVVAGVVLAVAALMGVFTWGNSTGFDEGVKAHAKGTWVVNTLADGSTVVTRATKGPPETADESFIAVIEADAKRIAALEARIKQLEASKGE